MYWASKAAILFSKNGDMGLGKYVALGHWPLGFAFDVSLYRFIALSPYRRIALSLFSIK